jgi:hypothetical protein
LLRPGVPAAVDAWFARAFSRDMRERFQSAGEMARALAAASTQPTAGASVGASTGSDVLEWPTLPFGPDITRTAAPTVSLAQPSPRWPWAAPLFAVAVMLVVSILGLHAQSAARLFSGASGADALSPRARLDSAVAASAHAADAGVNATNSPRSEGPCCP